MIVLPILPLVRKASGIEKYVLTLALILTFSP
jgi:hypothetical protein